MVDPRGGAYTVGLGLVQNLAVFPYHGTAADHLRERSIDLLPPGAVLAGIDEETALVLRDGTWTVAGAGEVTVYADGGSARYRAGDAVSGLPV
jgi:cyanophycinase